MSERQACKIVGLERSVKRYRAAPDRNEGLRELLRAEAYRKPKYGYRMLWKVLKRKGHNVNHKRIERLYREENLSLRRKKRSKRVVRERTPLSVASQPNEHWALDFVHDCLWSGRRLRCLTIVDVYSRYAPAIEVDFSLPGERVVRVLERLAFLRGLPAKITLDNGPELISKALVDWANKNGVVLDYIQPGKPMQNGFIESFNGTFRHECLDAHSFHSLLDVRTRIEKWRCEYNTERPHSSLGDWTPEEVEIDFYQRSGRYNGTNL